MMVTRSFLSIFVIVSCFEFSLGYQVKDGPLLTYRPPWLKLCRRSDPNLNQCVNDLFYIMFPALAKGIEEINVDPFEPLNLEEVSVTKGSGAVTLAGSFVNLTVVGPSNSTPTYTELDLARRKLNFGIYLPLLDIKSKYNLKGHILILPLVGHGNCEMKLAGVDTKVKAEISFRQKEGKEILHIDTMQVWFTVEKIRVRLDNLFNGNKVLGLTVNTFLNQHGLEIVKELEDPIGESLAQIFKDIINNVFTKLPTDLWLPAENESQTSDNKES